MRELEVVSLNNFSLYSKVLWLSSVALMIVSPTGSAESTSLHLAREREAKPK
jgi:hypothetical protein